VCKLTRRVPNAVARHLKPHVDGTPPRPPDACLPAERLVKVRGGPSPSIASGVKGASQKMARAAKPESGARADPASPLVWDETRMKNDVKREARKARRSKGRQGGAKQKQGIGRGEGSSGKTVRRTVYSNKRTPASPADQKTQLEIQSNKKSAAAAAQALEIRKVVR
jgi:hypothetical protein